MLEVSIVEKLDQQNSVDLAGYGSAEIQTSERLFPLYFNYATFIISIFVFYFANLFFKFFVSLVRA